MGHIKPQVAQLDSPQQGVHVGPVTVHQTTGLVYHPTNLHDVGIEEAQGAGQGYHHPSQLRPRHLVQRLQVHVAGPVRGQGDHLKSGHGRRRRVGAVGAVGNGYLAALGLSAVLVVGPDHQHPGQLAVGARQGGQADPGHAGYLLQELLELMQHRQGALGYLRRLEGVDEGEARQEGYFVVYLGVVLHGTTAQRVEMGVDGEV